MLNDNIDVIFSTQHLIFFTIAAVPVVIFGTLANAWYIYWEIRDKRLICSFAVILGNLALCNLVAALALPALNVASHIYHEPQFCNAKRIFRVVVELEIILLFLLLTMDRLCLLLKGLSSYLKVVTVRRTALVMLGSWVLVCVLNIALWSNAPEALQVLSYGDCHLNYPQSIAILPAVSDALMMLSCIYLGVRALLGRKTSQHSIASVESPDHLHPHLEAREDVGGDWKQPDSEKSTRVQKLQQSDSQRQQQQKYRETAREDTESGPTLDTAPSVDTETPSSKNLDDIAVDSSPAAENPPEKKSSVRSLITGVDGTGAATEERADTLHSWASYPHIKSTLPNLLSRMSQQRVSMQQSVKIARNQMFLMLGLHVVLGCPSYIARLVAVHNRLWMDDVLRLSFWLDIIFLLQACLYPLIYCYYSQKLREHLHSLSTRCKTQRHHCRVEPEECKAHYVKAAEA